MIRKYEKNPNYVKSQASPLAQTPIKTATYRHNIINLLSFYAHQ